MSTVARIASIFACLLAAACAGETQERPLRGPRGREAREEPARSAGAPPPPIQDSAGEPAHHAESRTVPTHEDRFSTKRIGREEGDGHRRFSGARVDLDLKGADVHDVFRLLADVGKVNIVVAGEVSGTLTMHLKQVPWDQALDVIVRARGLTYEREGNVILVKTATAAAGTK